MIKGSGQHTDETSLPSRVENRVLKALDVTTKRFFRFVEPVCFYCMKQRRNGYYCMLSEREWDCGQDGFTNRLKFGFFAVLPVSQRVFGINEQREGKRSRK